MGGKKKKPSAALILTNIFYRENHFSTKLKFLEGDLTAVLR